MSQVTHRLTIYVSGLYSGPNPSPGIGIARSLRLSYPDATLIGVDYSNRSHGIHWPDFNDVWLQRPWNELNLELYASQIEKILDSGALWISGLDLETIWLAHRLPMHPNLLVPSADALHRIGKPTIPACKELPTKIPPFLHLTLPDLDIHAFCRRYGWRVWLKGPYYEAYRVRNWTELNLIRSQLSKTWSTDRLFLQAHIEGYEECITFCAYKGHLLDCAYLVKRDITSEGKTWSGHISDVPEETLSPLRRIIEELNWTGGAELEMIRDTSGTLWLIEWNPRFPAWIHGATIAGRNLPALMVEHASGIPAQNNARASAEFTRVVIEIPVLRQFPLPPLPETMVDSFSISLKHPSGMPVLAERLRKEKLLNARSEAIQNLVIIERTSEILRTVVESVSSLDLTQLETPCHLFLKTIAAALFRQTCDAVEANSSGVQIAVAYSVKTNPDAQYLELALEHGFLAEVISQLELRKALSAGFDPAQIVMNGPGKWWPSIPSHELHFHAIFCDSLEELEWLISQYSRGCRVRYIGTRLRPPQFHSRFGIQIDEVETFRRLVSLVKKMPMNWSLGIHFHIPSSSIGIERWLQVYESILVWGRSIEAASGVKVGCVDVGGGWFPDDWFDLLLPQLDNLVDKALRYLPSIEQLILEPGRALAQRATVLLTRVLDLRRSNSVAKEVVVDASIAELPTSQEYPRCMLWLPSNGRGEILKRGEGVLFGRLCMENDIIAVGVEFPERIQIGDILAICDAGAYDRSMSYAFGRG